MTETHRIAAAGVSAVVSLKGAELVSLRDAGGEELLWQAGPEWPRHAPVLFPIVGRLAGDTLRHGGERYTMTQHGFARDRAFQWIDQGEAHVSLALTDDEETRARFPFAFRLELIYAVDGHELSVVSRVTNPGPESLPSSIGAHPAFRWPLAPGSPQESHVLVFESPEVGGMLPIEGGLLGPVTPLPFDGRVLPLTPELFDHDALVMPGVASRSVRYEARARDGSVIRAMTVSWRGYKDLGVWSKPGGAPFLCIEPWSGMASPIGWDGEFEDKPGVMTLAPGATAEFEWRVAI